MSIFVAKRTGLHSKRHNFMSKINIDRIVKDIKSRSNSLTPIIEAVCNSIDAIGFNRTDGLIDIIVKRDGQQKLELADNRASADIIAIDIVDNGDGFTDKNRDSFDTYLSGLKVSQGGKGFGRFMYLKYFNHVSVESVYWDGSKYKQRSFTFGHKSLFKFCSAAFLLQQVSPSLLPNRT